MPTPKRKEYMAAYYQANKESCKARTAKSRALNPERNKEYYYKNIDKHQKYYQDNKEEFLERGRQRYAKLKIESPETVMWFSARSRAREYGIEFNIEIIDIVIPKYCPVLGTELFFTSGKGPQNNSPSLDRFDNSKGYIKGNINVISWKANRIKVDASEEEIRKVADWMVSVDNKS